MDKISNLVHTSMLEFLATLNEDTLDGVFTARLTPCKFKRDHKLFEWQEETEVATWLGCLTSPPKPEGTPSLHDPNILKVLCFREYGAKVGVHYHIRFVTLYKTRKSIADHIKAHFPIPKGTGKGNEAYSVRDCKAKDKTVWKNASYIAKGNDCVFFHGYTPQEVEWFCEHASKYQKMEGKPKWEQILLWNEPALKQALGEKCFADTLVETIIKWHNLKNKEIPQEYQFGKIMHNISFKMNPKYREGMCNSLKNVYRRKNKDKGYDMVYLPPTEELPDWHNQ